MTVDLILMISIPLAAVIIFLLLLINFVKRRAHGAIDEANARFGDINRYPHEKAANYFGDSTKPMLEVRGNGVLVLGPKELWFRMWAPETTVSIPRSQIKEVFTKESHKGKTRFGKLLAVTFTNEKGEEATVAWQVRDLEMWLKALGSEGSLE